MTTYLIRPIQAVDLRQNESDGAILVELNGTIHADVIQADMIAITGESPNSATLYDLKTLLATIDADTGKMQAVDANMATAASGQKMTCTVASTDYSLTVVALATYLVTAQDGRIHLGITDGTGDDAAFLWTVPAGVTMPITIPSGTSLHYFSETACVIGRISRIN